MKLRTGLIAAAAALCLAGCGSTDDPSSLGGLVTLGTTATSATAGTSATTEAKTEATTAPKESTTKKTTEATKAATTTKPPATTPEQVTEAPDTRPAETEKPADTTPPPADTTPAPATPAPEPDPAPQIDLSTLAGKATVKYNDTYISIGDTFSNVKSKLGAESSPSESIGSCLTGENVNRYHYNGLDIDTTEAGRVIYFTIMEAMGSGPVAETACGVKVGDDLALSNSKFGTPYDDNGYIFYFSEGNLRVEISSYEGSSVDFIGISDTQYG